MLLQKICLATVLAFGGIATVQAADKMHDFNFKEAVDRAVADGTLDGSVKFYLAGTKSGGKAIQKGLVTNKRPMVLQSLLKVLVIMSCVQH